MTAGSDPRRTYCWTRRVIDTFAAKTTPGRWPHPDGATVAARLKALVNAPDAVDQGANGLCGPVTFLNIWLELDSVGVARFATDWLFRSVNQENYSLSDPSFADVAALVLSPRTKITLFIKTSMVGGSADGRHFINLRTPLTRNAAGNIVGDAWTWASIRRLSPEATFLDETVGWIVAELSTGVSRAIMPRT